MQLSNNNENERQEALNLSSSAALKYNSQKPKNMQENRRILVVDDEPYNILGIIIILKSLGYQDIIKLIDKAYNGIDALKLVKKGFQT